MGLGDGGEDLKAHSHPPVEAVVAGVHWGREGSYPERAERALGGSAPASTRPARGRVDAYDIWALVADQRRHVFESGAPFRDDHRSVAVEDDKVEPLAGFGYIDS